MDLSGLRFNVFLGGFRGGGGVGLGLFWVDLWVSG